MRETDPQWVPTGIGKKVTTETAPTPDRWVKGNRPGTFRNETTGKTETRIPGNEAANHQSMADVWREYLRKQQEALGEYTGFQPF